MSTSRISDIVRAPKRVGVSGMFRPIKSASEVESMCFVSSENGESKRVSTNVCLAASLMRRNELGTRFSRFVLERGCASINDVRRKCRGLTFPGQVLVVSKSTC